ncbi:thermonuclease family protein [Qipengyuania gaetbuli]|uniref:thermonuclease family protein n=1 Tax=Qipengyuania gaetbuli TaxID=266952 RepID=UPI001C9A1C6B|nr:thermonuclease family protein [Qipengyuania gaetbuli]MBY6015134.1 thermonuclease family protein [Qipengyuania gaetbuli]
MKDIPPPPPGFRLEDPAKPKPKAKRLFQGEVRTPPAIEGQPVRGAVDGDTFRSDAGNVRLLGVDAPELKQQGWDRQGDMVPVGIDASNFANGYIVNPQGRFGTPEPYLTWGRAVAPIEVGDKDAGQMMIRSGNAFAAPEYLDDHPERRFQYQHAENNARMNRLGVHDVQMQSPEDFRSRGSVSISGSDELPDGPDKEAYARFWDTPTRFAGLESADEKQFLSLVYSPEVPVADAVAYVQERGGLVEPASIERARDYYLKTGKMVGLNYTSAPKMMIDEGHSQADAAALAFGDGFLMEGLGEVGAVVDTLGGTANRESVWNSERRLADIWQNNQRQNEAILRFDADKFPKTTLGASITGGLTSGVVAPIGGGLRGAKLAAVGAGMGGANGFLGTDGTFTERLAGAGPGMAVGAIADPALAAILDKAAPVARRFIARGRGGEAAEGGSTAGRAAESSGVEVAEEVGGDYVDSQVPPPPAGFRLEAPAAIPMALDGSPSLSIGPPNSAFATARRLLDPTSKADLMASASRVQPGDVLPFPGNRVDGVEEAAGIDAGRYLEAKPYDERMALSRATVRNWRGEDVPKVGPLDLVGYVRSLGGLRDEGGELAHMGITSNAARRGMDFVGQEARFGPLVDAEGMSFDDAALSAWEAGYFPQTERPDINTFLEALGETYNGGAGRRFRTDDLGEVDAFNALRDERISLEEQRFDGTRVVNDMAGPADDAPFPPVEAYEEWPSDAIQRVGNVDVTKLDSPQDIARALKTTENALGGFDAAKRGRITQAETERLASDLNMTPEQLLSRRKGQAFNAEEALAARQILAKSANELVNAARRIKSMDDPGEELLAEFRKKWMRHAAIQEQVSGMTAEAGRALQQFKQSANARAVRTDVLGALIRAGGGKAGLKDAAETLLDAVEMGPGKFNALAEKAAKPKWRQKIGELYINFLLSNPPTHIVNMVSNSATALLQVPEYAAGAAIGAVRRAVAGPEAKERILASEVGARAIGLLQGTKEGARLFSKALRTGEADDFVSKVEGDEFKAISGIKGEVIRVPTRLLTAEDQLFKGIARRMELNALATRQAAREGLRGDDAAERIAALVSDPPDEMLERAMDYGRYLTFQRQLGETGQAISRAANSNLLGKVVIPFVRTPINLLKFAAERSPVAPVLKEWRKDFAAGGERRDMAVARMMLGTGFAAVMYEAALEGKITGAVPPDPKKAKLLYADGWQPYSVKIGDSWVSYSRLDPLSTTIGVAADMATLPEGLSERQADDRATMLVASIMGNLASKTWLSGMSDFVEGLSDPGRNAGNWLERVVSSFAVPAGVAGAARAIDPVARKRESIGEAVQARVPFMTDELYPRRDVFGEPVKLDSFGPDFLSPFWQSQDKSDPVVAEMLRIDKGVYAPGKQYTDGGERLDYTPAEYDRYHEVAGRLTYNSLLGLIGSAEYGRLDDTGKRKAATKAIAKARKDARAVLDEQRYSIPAKGAGYSAPLSGPEPAGGGGSNSPMPPPPPGFRIEGESAGVNVYGDLKDAIPGVGITSGYRTREYQADMRRRGYNPASNSAHLDGSALDLTPPAGRSMGWLKARVRNLYPDAQLLDEGDHLHAVFPGYYGAPVLGGARSAGLRNPSEGIPPPPPGFTVQ